MFLNFFLAQDPQNINLCTHILRVGQLIRQLQNIDMIIAKTFQRYILLIGSITSGKITEER